MKPFRDRGQARYKLYVRTVDGRRRKCSCGTDRLTTATAVARFVERLRSERRWDVLTPIVEAPRHASGKLYDGAKAWIAEQVKLDMRRTP